MLALGQWFYPNSSTVNIRASNETIYRNRDWSVVRLNRRGDTTSPTGKFCCEIPDASYTLIKMCVNLVTDPSITSLAMVASGLKCKQPSTTTSTMQTTSYYATKGITVVDLAAVAIGGGLAVIILMTSATILLCVARRCRLKHTKGNSAITDDIQMTQNDLYTVAAKVQQHSDSASYHGVTSQKAAAQDQQTSTPNNMYTDVCDNTYEYVINN